MIMRTIRPVGRFFDGAEGCRGSTAVGLPPALSLTLRPYRFVGTQMRQQPISLMKDRRVGPLGSIRIPDRTRIGADLHR